MKPASSTSSSQAWGRVPPPPPPHHPEYIAPNPRHPWLAPGKAHAWRWIVIHHSATDRGSATSFDREHRRRGWDGLGYHFVIDNGNGAADGLVEIGSRWTRQKWGAHAGVEAYNQYGIGICLVGDFDKTRPTPRQLNALVQLVGFLSRTYNIPAERIIGHRDIKKTNCPGRHLDLTWLRRAVRR